MRITAHFAFLCVFFFYYFDCGHSLVVVVVVVMAISQGRFHWFEQTLDQLMGESDNTGSFLYFVQPCSPKEGGGVDDW